MSKKVILSLSLLASTFLAGSPTLAAPVNSAPQPAPNTQPQTAPDTQSQPAPSTQPQPVPRTQSQPAPSQPTSSNPFLSKDDLPSGFKEVPTDLKSQVIRQMTTFLQQQIPGANLKPENLFAYFNPENSEVLMGYTDKLADQRSQASFDTNLKQIQQPDAQKKLLSTLQEKVKNLKEYKVEIVDYKQNPDLSNIANVSTGVTLSLKIQDQPVHADIISFRRNAIVAVATVVNLNGQQPTLSVSDIARKIDARISKLSSAAN